MSLNLDDLLESANRLEPLPASATRLTALLADPDWDLREVVRVVELDATLTARILRVANSILYSPGRQIATVREAVLRMGAASAACVAVGVGARSTMMRALPLYGAREDLLWRHSVASALAVQCMAQSCKIQPPPEAFTAALLHDVGKILMCQSMSAELIGLLRTAQSQGLSELDAEWDVLHVTHAELGGMVANHWRLPEAIVEGICSHHVPLRTVRSAQLPVARCVHLANCVAKSIGTGPEGAKVSDEEAEPILSELALRPEQYQSLCACVRGQLDSTLALYAP